MIGTIAQVGIFIFGLSAIALTQLGSEGARRLAPFFGLTGQFFWLPALYGQWGMFTVSLAYTAIWMAGCWRVLKAARQDVTCGYCCGPLQKQTSACGRCGYCPPLRAPKAVCGYGCGCVNGCCLVMPDRAPKAAHG